MVFNGQKIDWSDVYVIDNTKSSMTDIIIEITNGIVSIVKCSFWSVLTVIGLGAGFLFLTNPEEKTLWPYVNLLISLKNKELDSVKQKLVELGVDYSSQKTSTVYFQNFLFFRVATITLLDGQTVEFCGALQNWYLLGVK